MTNWGFIYAFVVDSKGYVGWTTDLKRRFKTHFREKKWNPYFHNSLRKNFPNNPNNSFKILEAHKRNGESNLEFKKILDEREIFWTAKLGTFDPKQKKGWNLTKGGGGVVGIKRPDLSKRNKEWGKEGKYTGEKNPNFGIKAPWRTKENKKRKETGEFLGEKNPRAKSVVLISPEGKKYQLPCYVPFCKEHGLNPGGMCGVLKGNLKSYRGWTGKYLEKR